MTLNDEAIELIEALKWTLGLLEEALIEDPDALAAATLTSREDLDDHCELTRRLLVRVGGDQRNERIGGAFYTGRT